MAPKKPAISRDQLLAFFHEEAEDFDVGRFSRASTKNVADHFGVPPAEAYRALAALAKTEPGFERSKMGRAGFRDDSYRGVELKSGFQTWEVPDLATFARPGSEAPTGAKPKPATEKPEPRPKLTEWEAFKARQAGIDPKRATAEELRDFVTTLRGAPPVRIGFGAPAAPPAPPAGPPPPPPGFAPPRAGGPSSGEPGGTIFAERPKIEVATALPPTTGGRVRRGDPTEILRLGRQQALSLADRVGGAEVERMMREAAAELEERIRSAVGGQSATPTSIREMQATLGQVRDVVQTLARKLGRATVDVATEAADATAASMFDYLQDAHTEFGLTPGRPLPIREAAMFSRAVAGAESSVLRRLATTEADQRRLDVDPDTGDMIPDQPMRPGGVLSRYGMATIGEFEAVLQRGMLTGKPWGDVRDELTSKSPFLEGAPKYWAERIVRTETMGAANRAGWETIRAADDELGDMVKILSAVFDDRTGWDSYQVHGQIRLPDEAFAWAGGLYQAPPNRPNDREVVVPHRIAWVLPDELSWRGDGEVAAAWKRDRRKGSPPPRPLMTTIPLARFGKTGGTKKDESKAAAAPVGDAGGAAVG